MKSIIAYSLVDGWLNGFNIESDLREDYCRRSGNRTEEVSREDWLLNFVPWSRNESITLSYGTPRGLSILTGNM